MWNLKYDTSEFIFKTETDIKTNMVIKGERAEKDKLEFGLSIYTLLYIQ